jgi:hypothetical protein
MRLPAFSETTKGTALHRGAMSWLVRVWSCVMGMF